MCSFRAKFVLALLAVYLLFGVFPATSSSVHVHPHDSLIAESGEKICLSMVDCGDGLRKITGRKGGSFGCQNDNVSKRIVPVRSLRISLTSAPPSPIKSIPKSQGGYAPPPLSI